MEEYLRQYDLYVEGPSSVLLQDVEQEKILYQLNLPGSISAVVDTLKTFHVLLTTVLGPLHPLVKEHRDMLLTMDQMRTRWEHRLMPEHWSQILRYVQIGCHTYFEAQPFSASTIPPPDFADLPHRINMGIPWAPTMPADSAGRHNAGAGQQATPRAGPSNPITSTNNSRYATDRTKVLNLNYDSTYATHKGGGVQLKEARENGRTLSKYIPQNSDGTEMCLSWHILGFCYDNCARKQDHRKQKQTEKTDLQAWCQACFTALPT